MREGASQGGLEGVGGTDDCMSVSSERYDQRRGRTSNGCSFSKPNAAANVSQEVNARIQTSPESLGET